MAQFDSSPQSEKFTAPSLYLFSWHFEVGDNPHIFSVAVSGLSSEMQENEKQAIIKMQRLLKEEKYIKHEGCYTKSAPFDKINFYEESLRTAAVRPPYHKDSSIDELLKLQKPEVNDLNAIISVSCLDG